MPLATFILQVVDQVAVDVVRQVLTLYRTTYVTPLATFILQVVDQVAVEVVRQVLTLYI